MSSADEPCAVDPLAVDPAVRLLDSPALDGRLVLDLGCGPGAVAEDVQRLGAEYVGLDIDPDAVKELRRRGFEAHTLDLSSALVGELLARVVGERRVGGVLCLDLIEHLNDPAALLRALRGLERSSGDMELVIRVGNVAHLDLARRLLVGEWPALDPAERVPARLFNAKSLTELMASTGWFEAARMDSVADRILSGDRLHPVLDGPTAVGNLLSRLREGVDEFGSVDRFVRRYHRGAPRPAEDRVPAGQPFLSVVTRTQGNRPDTLRDVLCCLGAQTDSDFEVILVVHSELPSVLDQVVHIVDEFDDDLRGRCRVLPCSGGTRARPANAGLDAALGEYVVYLDDDDLVTADWVQNIREGARLHPGKVVRWYAAEQARRHVESELASHLASGGFVARYATPFDLVSHLHTNETPFHTFAFPRALRDLGLRFDESLSVLEDWQFLLRAASLCGVHDTSKLTSIYNRWESHASAHCAPPDEWRAMRNAVIASLRQQPLLLSPESLRAAVDHVEQAGSARRRTAQLERELRTARREVAEAHRQVRRAERRLDKSERARRRLEERLAARERALARIQDAGLVQALLTVRRVGRRLGVRGRTPPE